jgi:hypothetical protein
MGSNYSKSPYGVGNPYVAFGTLIAIAGAISFATYYMIRGLARLIAALIVAMLPSRIGTWLDAARINVRLFELISKFCSLITLGPVVVATVMAHAGRNPMIDAPDMRVNVLFFGSQSSFMVNLFEHIAFYGGLTLITQVIAEIGKRDRFHAAAKAKPSAPSYRGYKIINGERRF